MTPRRLAERPVVITGGTSGIDEATARRFAAEGATVSIADIQDAAAEKVVSEIPVLITVRNLG
jgi:NAD(P)-dependent dehydrogenase (short-subunit alcohol dehydrogenase family)